MKILGVVFGQVTKLDNWQPKLTKLENHLNLWISRSLSLVWKSLIINTLDISKLLYLATILSVPRWVVSAVNNLISPFLWGCRIETATARALKLASVLSLCTNTDSKSFYFIKYFLVLDYHLSARSGVSSGITLLRAPNP